MKKKLKKVNARPPVIMKSGQRMCANRDCRAIFTPDRFEQTYCSDECDKKAERVNLRGRAVQNGRLKIRFVPLILLLLPLFSCQQYMTDQQIRESISVFEQSVDSLKNEQMLIVEKQNELFMRWRGLYKKMKMIDTSLATRGISSDDSLSILTSFLLNDIAMDATVESMQRQSAIYDDIRREIIDMNISINELGYYQENHVRDAPEKLKSVGIIYAEIVGYTCAGIIVLFVFFNISVFLIKKRSKNGKQKT